jgi:uncharacterized membrane-anchored protein
MIKGRVLAGCKTKKLVKRIKPGDIALIAHQDIDQIAGDSLREARVKAIINVKKSVSGKYPNKGPLTITKANIPIIDNCNNNIFDQIQDGDIIKIEDGNIYKKGLLIGKGTPLSNQKVLNLLEKANNNLNQELKKFIDNTLTYARREMDLILDVPVPNINKSFEGRHVLIVVRGADYKEDLKLISSYINKVKPFIIGVDGGADACLNEGYLPDIIIGDMDSVSDKALCCGSQLIVHAYPDGTAPGLQRINSLNLEATIFPAPGTSEDIAMLLAYEKGADLITAVGTHSHMIDFLEKGRSGMASTLLVRLKIGNKLVDAKGLSKIYNSKLNYHYMFGVVLSLLLPIVIIIFSAPSLRQFFQLVILRLSLIF